METLTETITETITSREGGVMATIQDIARISGYSIGTVSRVINHRADVSEETRKKIEAVIREQNYQPNTSARMLRRSVSSEVSIIVRGTGNTFLQSVLEKVQICIQNHGENANVQFIGETEDEVAVAAQLIQHLKPKGLVFLGGSIPSFREEFSRIDVPSVLISANAEGLGCEGLSSFSTDDVDAGATVMKALLAQGHRRIGILGGYREGANDGQPEDGPALRIWGAVRELQESGVSFDFGRDYEGCPFSAEEGYQATRRLLQRTPDLTGIFAISDTIAIGAMRAFYDLGLRVPEDISVVGFDGIAYARYCVPRLATIRQDTEALALRGVEDLLMRVSYERPAVHERIPYQYVAGESVARPRE